MAEIKDSVFNEHDDYSLDDLKFEMEGIDEDGMSR